MTDNEEPNEFSEFCFEPAHASPIMIAEPTQSLESYLDQLFASDWRNQQKEQQHPDDQQPLKRAKTSEAKEDAQRHSSPSQCSLGWVVELFATNKRRRFLDAKQAKAWIWDYLVNFLPSVEPPTNVRDVAQAFFAVLSKNLKRPHCDESRIENVFSVSTFLMPKNLGTEVLCINFPWLLLAGDVPSGAGPFEYEYEFKLGLFEHHLKCRFCRDEDRPWSQVVCDDWRHFLRLVWKACDQAMSSFLTTYDIPQQEADSPLDDNALLEQVTNDWQTNYARVLPCTVREVAKALLKEQAVVPTDSLLEEWIDGFFAVMKAERKGLVYWNEYGAERAFLWERILWQVTSASAFLLEDVNPHIHRQEKVVAFIENRSDIKNGGIVLEIGLSEDDRAALVEAGGVVWRDILTRQESRNMSLRNCHLCQDSPTVPEREVDETPQKALKQLQVHAKTHGPFGLLEILRRSKLWWEDVSALVTPEELKLQQVLHQRNIRVLRMNPQGVFEDWSPWDGL